MATVTQTMNSVPAKELSRYEQAVESKHELDWADLVTLDLSKFDAPGGKQELASQLKDAVHKVGFVGSSSIYWSPACWLEGADDPRSSTSRTLVSTKSRWTANSPSAKSCSVSLPRRS